MLFPNRPEYAYRTQNLEWEWQKFIDDVLSLAIGDPISQPTQDTLIELYVSNKELLGAFIKRRHTWTRNLANNAKQ